MYLVVYGDFNCPYSYLASNRVDVLLDRRTAQVEWRPVEHDRGIPQPTEPLKGDQLSALEREIAEVRALRRPGEPFTIEPPHHRPNTARAIAAFAAAPLDEDHDTRRRLFAALWRHGRDLGDPTVVHELVGHSSAPGVPLVEAWRDAWLSLGRSTVPMLELPDGYVWRGLGALRRLADLAATSTRFQPRQSSQVAT
jgi:hypothetical protein